VTGVGGSVAANQERAGQGARECEGKRSNKLAAATRQELCSQRVFCGRQRGVAAVERTYAGARQFVRSQTGDVRGVTAELAEANPTRAGCAPSGAPRRTRMRALQLETNSQDIAAPNARPNVRAKLPAEACAALLSKMILRSWANS
jgi:hypothetical protein